MNKLFKLFLVVGLFFGLSQVAQATTRTATIVSAQDTGVYVSSWTGLLNGDVGNAVPMPKHSDRTVQVIGQFSVGGTAVLQGSNDGSNWFTLTDPQGNAISFTAAGGKAVTEVTRYVRPSITAGDGSTNLIVLLLLKLVS